MSTDAPITVDSRSGDAALRPVTHRTKHRKEVKRYHQRQQNKKLREEAKARDAQLFLFERNANAEVDSAGATAGKETSTAAAAKNEASQPRAVKGTDTVKTITQRSDASGTRGEAAPVASPQANQVAAPLLPLATSSWDFEFALRKSTFVEPAGANDDTAAAKASVNLAPNETAEGKEAAAAQHALVSANTRSLTAFPTPPPHQTSLVTAARCPPRSFADHAAEQRNRPSGNSEPISVLPVDTAVVGSINKLLSNAHVQRVDGVAAVPMEAPLSAGTDLNRPPRTYLTLDPIFNVHQHAPGFVRDQRVALQHMLATSMANWKDMQQNALIVTSAEAVRTIFEQVYVPSRPLAMRVRRLGPTIVIDSRASQPSQVLEMRQQALFSKALYLMKETHGRDTAAEDAATTAQMALAVPERRLCSVSASDPSHFGANLHRYSQLLRWRIDSTELLVGNDAPVVLDQRTGTEQLVRIKAADQSDSTDTEQRETLQCWFDATLANVSHVGTYLHCDGVLLNYQVRKTNDLLGYVEARLAGAALNFTSTTLQWLVKHCQRDGGTYAMFRDFTEDCLKLYELPEMDDTKAFMEETEKHFSASPAQADPQGRGGATSHIGGTESPFARYPSNAPHLNRFSLNFGRTCLNIGQHLYREGGVGRAKDALTLLHRCLRVFLPCCVTETVAREAVVDVVQMLPALVARKMQADANSTATAAASSCSGANNSNGSSNGSCVPCNNSANNSLGNAGAEKTPAGFVTASCSSPELYRDALLLCGKFDIPLRRAFVETGGSAGDPLMQAFYARCLVASSAAVCTVVAASLEAYYCGCHHLRVMRKARSEAKSKDGKSTALRGVDHREDVMVVLASMIQDLLQVVVEGLVRLEETSALISPLHAAEAASTTTTTTTTTTAAADSPSTLKVPQSTTNTWAVPASALQTLIAAPPSSTERAITRNAKGAKEEAGSVGDSSSSTASLESVLSPASSASEGEEGTTNTATTNGSSKHHARQLRTSSPARVAVTAAQSGAIAVDGSTVRTAPCGTVVDPRTQVDTTPLRSALCELYGDVVMLAMADAASGFTTRALGELGARLEARAQAQSQRLPTTLLWLTALKPDVVSLSFTALRFYGRVATHTRRHLLKLAQVYYLVGKEHHRTARYTKALEVLHRAKSLLQASHKAPEDVVFGDAFGSHGLMQWADVMLLLGDVYRSVVERKLETALGVAAITVAQPLLVGPLHNLPEEADTFFAQALNAYKQGGSDEGCKSAKACTLLLYASVLMERVALSGEPASHAASQRIAELLRDSEALAPSLYVAEREWQTVRLFTVTSPTAADGALTRAVEEILLRFACCTLQQVRATTDDGALEPPPKEPLWVDADVVDCYAHRRERHVLPPPCSMMAETQKALACCVMVERLAPARTADVTARGREVARPTALVTASESKYRSLLRWIGRAAACMTTALQTFLRSKDVWRTAAARHQWMSTLRTWGEQTLGSCLHHLVCMITLRLLNAAQGRLPGPKQAEAREAFKQVTMKLEAGSGASADSDEAHELIVKSLKELNELLVPFTEW
ncbi:hypothetical protein ABB37_08195 [Leptomonas pyrrhocoris]|uniref:EDRF1 N-terminal domain-containing protein n=1 Tax=Leptomonas pyrrhocoris TaxID=157538 RepID=A0A0M9FU41_LEPPY|nr:hypothetical protein ABB37_08195 [Leptomonas pyrrhocoris]XP_015654502.1 hypothetical protein ABB37_08195 [Leptomonas pyrrhocoris]KPA76062.1 hypothetical protein ABB37_08195 [Leptomonas pyrrhocoris]KPA76063.1 hypothetical protein ABB37_08195 [Leptomonas pyrrhocoris]|eukprot:XP_015654501.1 hypothetical protein ABB37_08195 [Leptomonas pyrrhocoris]